MTSYPDNKWLGDPSFDPIWRKRIAARPSYILSTKHICCRGLLKDVNPNIVEFGTDDSHHRELDLFRTTSISRHKFIMSHGGGTAST
jgi:hypothetical protein